MKHLIICLLFFTTFTAAQIYNITGKVVDSGTNKPIPLTNIIFEGSFKGNITSENGSFELKSDFKETEYITFSHLGYYQKRIPVKDLIQQENLIIKLEPKILSSQTVLVTGSIGKEGVTPVAYSKIRREDIEQNYIQQDIPQFLNTLPSTTFYSQSGNGTGYNFLSIRGFDQRRISVSVNGIPQNDPEDHNVYWLDMPDLLASTEMIQVQRGAGSGVIGYPAIGGSINIITSAFSNKPKFEVSSSIGSYNSRKYSASFSSGLVDEKYSVYAKLSKTLSSGYRNHSWIDYNSYHLSAVRYDKNFTTQVNMYGGPIADGLDYTGLPKFAVKDKELRRENHSYWEADRDSFTLVVPRRNVEIENFSQPHFELLNEIKFNDKTTFNSAVFLVLGTGFFDFDGSWTIWVDDYFRLKANGYDSNFIPTNALIRAQVENKQYGWIPRISFKHTNGEFIIGSEIRVHRSLHWGSINYAENLPAGVTKDYKYYQYRGGKDIFNFFVHESYNFGKLNILGELQTAYHNYKLYEEKYVGNDFTVDELFFNGRLGVNYKVNDNTSTYISFARVSREPRLTNFYDAAESSGGKIPQFERNTNGGFNFNEPFVKPETLNDIETGASFSNEKITAGLNLFYMLFDDEIVKQGTVDRFGQPVTGNMDRTIHTGIELTGSARITDNLELILNSTYSKNYISKGSTFIKYNDGETIIPLDISDNRISGFPDLLFTGIVKFNYGGLYANLTTKYVGKFYSDNYDKNLNLYQTLYPGLTDDDGNGAEDYFDNVVPAYFVADLFASYSLDLNSFPNNFKIYVQVNNIFNKLYAGFATGKEFFPAAERNFLVGISLGL